MKKYQYSILPLLVLFAFNRSSWSQDLFVDVTEAMGVTWTEEVPYNDLYNVAWADFNGDNFPDLWISPYVYKYGSREDSGRLSRWRRPQLFINQAAAGFHDTLLSVWSKVNAGVEHFATWSDFDNDGDQDVFINGGCRAGQEGAPCERHLLVNENGLLVDRAIEFGLSPMGGRGRGNLWVDYDKDGLLDLAVFNRSGAYSPSSRLFRQTASKFVDVSAQAGFIFPDHTSKDKDSARFGVVSDLFGDNVPDILVFDGQANNPSFIIRAYRNPGAALEDISHLLPVVSLGTDVVVADFNQDTIPDIFIVGGMPITKPTLFQGADQSRFFARFQANKGEEGVSFKSAGNVTFDWPPSAPPVFIGAQARSPSATLFTLSPNDPNVQGLAPRVRLGLYIGYDANLAKWTMMMKDSKAAPKGIQVIAETGDLTEVTPINFIPVNAENPRYTKLPVYLEYDVTLGQYVNRTAKAGFTKPLNGCAVVAGDFDNDLDQDIYINQTHRTTPLQSVYYENQGNGTFVEVAGVKGAALPLRGATAGSFAGAPSMAVADYDLNGFLDLFIAADVYGTGNTRFYVGVPARLFKNQGNGNHWMQIDLQGTVSNRDAIGAKVLVRTADGRVQVRIQDGGGHAGGQNQHRLHFGLGANTSIDQIKVVWPNGNIQTIDEILAADQILHVVEGNNLVEAVR